MGVNQVERSLVSLKLKNGPLGGTGLQSTFYRVTGQIVCGGEPPIGEKPFDVGQPSVRKSLKILPFHGRKNTA
jgi:hypothetical protein